MCILRGFPTDLAKTSTDGTFPFGIWFANPRTLYVADEGNGDATYSASSHRYTTAAASTHAGLQKWLYETASRTWKLAYTVQNGLNLGAPYMVPGYRPATTPPLACRGPRPPTGCATSRAT